MSEEKGKTMKITSLTVDNFMRVKVAEIIPKGDVIELTGRNGSGKTSTLDGVLALLRGSETPSDPIRHGASKANVEMVIDDGELVISRTYTKKGNRTGTITITPNGKAPLNSPQAVMDKLIGTRCLDPARFHAGKPADQFEELRQIVGIDFAELDEKREGLYKDRTSVNSDLRSAQARLESATAPEENCPTKLEDVSPLIDRLTSASSVNRENDRHRANLNNATLTKFEAIERKKELEVNLEDIKKKELRVAGQIEEENNAISQHERDELQCKKDVAALEDIDAESIKAQINAIEKQNALAREYQAYGEIKSNLDRAKKESRELTRFIDDIDSFKQRELEAAEFPVDGLSLSDGEVMYNGAPLSQASDGEKWLVACAISMCGNPKLKIIIIRAGSMLDEFTREKIYTIANDKGFQVWIETVDTSGKVGIVFEDGEIVRDNDADEPEEFELKS